MHLTAPRKYLQHLLAVASVLVSAYPAQCDSVIKVLDGRTSKQRLSQASTYTLQPHDNSSVIRRNNAAQPTHDQPVTTASSSTPPTHQPPPPESAVSAISPSVPAGTAPPEITETDFTLRLAELAGKSSVPSSDIPPAQKQHDTGPDPYKKATADHSQPVASK